MTVILFFLHMLFVAPGLYAGHRQVTKYVGTGYASHLANAVTLYAIVLFTVLIAILAHLEGTT